MPSAAFAAVPAKTADVQTKAADENELKLWYDEKAPASYDGWEKWSLPLGNSGIGASEMCIRDRSGRLRRGVSGICGGQIPQKQQEGRCGSGRIHSKAENDQPRGRLLYESSRDLCRPEGPV